MDIAKCFDQISRPLLYRLAEAAGMPPGILSAYKRYQESLKVHNTIAKGIGKAFTRKCGIPQGCPLSMMFTSFIMRPWMIKCKSISENIDPTILADDILTLAHGEKSLDLFIKALNLIHQYIKDMGGKLAEGKSINFASNAEHRKWLEQSEWEATPGKGIEVVSDFRYLGSHMTASGKANTTTNKKRIKTGILQCGKLKRPPIDRKKKASTVRTEVYAGALYGAEVVQIPERQMADLSRAVIQILTNKGTNQDLDSTFAACSWGDDLDPVVQVLVKACMALRRAIAKRPHSKIHYQKTHKLYVQIGAEGATTSNDYQAQANGELANLEPAPHPAASGKSKKKWMKGPQAVGQIGHLIRMVHLCGAKLNEDFEILMHNEAPVSIIDTPYKFLPKAIMAIAVRARTMAAQ